MTPNEIAQWMLNEVETQGMLYQYEAASDIESRFGSEFVPENENGNPSIRADVLKAFRSISEDSVVWERVERLWRKRETFDEPGRRQE